MKRIAALLVCGLSACGRGLDAARVAPAPAAPRATNAAAAALAPAAPGVYEHALLVSVDGLRSDALIASPRGTLPSFERLLQGASTLNARTDPDVTVTLPNHTGMLTSRLFQGPQGHGWSINDDPPDGLTLHKQRGSYIAGIFDVAHDRGVATAMYVGKTKFSLYDQSWDGEHGAPDTTDADDGRDKLDVFRYCERAEQVADGVIESTSLAGRRTLVFAHFGVTDLTAHSAGWDVTPGSRYLKAVAIVDRELGRILDAIEAAPALAGHTLVVLTSDHGGGAPFKSHEMAHMWIDYTIPFIVWTGAHGGARDLYALNQRTRKDPSIYRPRIGDEGLPPIRNADAGNLVLGLMGLPPIPGSTVDVAQDLALE